MTSNKRKRDDPGVFIIRFCCGGCTDTSAEVEAAVAPPVVDWSTKRRHVDEASGKRNENGTMSINRDGAATLAAKLARETHERRAQILPPRDASRDMRREIALDSPLRDSGRDMTTRGTGQGGDGRRDPRDGRGIERGVDRGGGRRHNRK